MIYAVVKRLFDIVFSLVGLVLLLPTTLIIKVVYCFTGDFHPIFYKQERVGKKGKKFKILKFRSMSWDADQKLEKLLAKEKYRKQWEEYQKIDDDPRVTKVGKFIRTGSIDEMPQFINVFLGQMSVVGPRPLVPGELRLHKGDEKKYTSVKPGITGYWAMRGRSNNDYEERLKLEYYYIDNRSIKLDCKILLKTLDVVFRKEGAK